MVRSFEQYLNIRRAYHPSFSPDGKTISFLSTISGVSEIWSVPIDMHAQVPAWPEQLTFRGERVTSAIFSPTNQTLLMASDVGGNERTQLYTLSSDGSSLQALTSQPDVI